jgi:hypothetical protein
VAAGGGWAGRYAGYVILGGLCGDRGRGRLTTAVMIGTGGPAGGPPRRLRTLFARYISGISRYMSWARLREVCKDSGRGWCGWRESRPGARAGRQGLVWLAGVPAGCARGDRDAGGGDRDAGGAAGTLVGRPGHWRVGRGWWGWRSRGRGARGPVKGAGAGGPLAFRAYPCGYAARTSGFRLPSPDMRGTLLLNVKDA